MKNLFYICLLFSSCSVFKHTAKNNSSQKDLTLHAEQRKDSLQLKAQALRIRFLSDDGLEMTEILPVGRFIYSLDAGFKGEAARVWVYHQYQQRSVERDTSALSLAAGSDRLGVDNTLHERAQQHLEETKKSKLISCWIYVLAGMILIMMNAGRKKD